MQRIYSFQNTDAILYVVSTPIGNLKELSPRALETLNLVDYIASEDTRTTGTLLHEFGISKPMISCHEHNEAEASKKIVELLQNGYKIALTSDAGYPGISDPGAKLIKHVIDNNLPVSVVNGSSAFLPALIASGLNTDHFYFHGFLKPKSSERKKELEKLKNYNMTMIFYESPHRIIDTLKDMYQVLSNRKITLAREITKMYEEYIRGDLKELIDLDVNTLKGEMVLILEGNQNDTIIDEKEMISIIRTRLKENISKKDLSRELADIYNWKKNDVYQLIIKEIEKL